MQSIQVCGHAAKRDRDPVVVQFLAIVSKELGAKELIDAAFIEQRVAQRRLVLEPDGEDGGNLAAVQTAPKAGVGIGSFEGEDVHEGIADGHSAHLGGSCPGGIECSDEGAHAGAGEPVDGDAVLLKPLEYADVGQTQSAAAFQSQADGRTVSGDNCRQRSVGIVTDGSRRLLAPCGRDQHGGDKEDCRTLARHGDTSWHSTSLQANAF